MLKKFKSQSEEKKRLLSNFFSLSILQMVNYILPLIIVPYLFITLGTEKFGLIAFAQSIVIYFGLFVNYGFNLSATKEIAVHRSNQEKISEIYSSVTIIKFLLLCVAFIFFSLLIFSFDRFSDDWRLYLYTFGTVVESILFPVWFFQGMEKMKYITIIYSISKIIVTGFIFLIIKTPDDYLYVPLLYFIGSISSGTLSLFVLFSIFKIKFFIPSVNHLVFQLQDGWHLFISNFTKNMYRNANILILGLFTSTLYVGYYALAEKVIKALQALMGPVSDVLYPYMANKSAKQHQKKSLDDIFNISKYYSYILVAIVAGILIFAPYIVRIVGGSYLDNVIADMRILSFVIFFGVLNDLFGVIGLISLGYKKYFMMSVLFAGALNVMLSFVFVFDFKDIGVATALSISEFVLTILLLSKLLRLKYIKGNV